MSDDRDRTPGTAGHPDPRCLEFQGDYVESVLLGRSPSPRTADHVASCLRCAPAADDVLRVAATFARADLPVRPAREPAPRVLRGVPHRTARPRVPAPRRRRRILLPAAAALLLTVTGVAAVDRALSAPDRIAAQTAGSLSATGPATSTVRLLRDGRMIAHSWGAEVPVVLEGLQTGQTYRLATEDVSGELVPAGSVRADGGTVRTRMTTATSRDRIAVLLVTDSTGQALARMEVTPPDGEG